jgi:hypothetical protein
VGGPASVSPIKNNQPLRGSQVESALHEVALYIELASG